MWLATTILLSHYRFKIGKINYHLSGVNSIKWLKSIELKGNHQIQLANHIKNTEFLNSEIIQIEKEISTSLSTNEIVTILF